MVVGVLKLFKRPVRSCCIGRCGSAESVLCVGAVGVRKRGTVRFDERGRFIWLSRLCSIEDVTRGVKVMMVQETKTSQLSYMLSVVTFEFWPLTT